LTQVNGGSRPGAPGLQFPHPLPIDAGAIPVMAN
jgi:hypothetical protein